MHAKPVTAWAVSWASKAHKVWLILRLIFIYFWKKKQRNMKPTSILELKNKKNNEIFWKYRSNNSTRPFSSDTANMSSVTQRVASGSLPSLARDLLFHWHSKMWESKVHLTIIIFYPAAVGARASIKRAILSNAALIHKNDHEIITFFSITKERKKKKWTKNKYLSKSAVSFECHANACTPPLCVLPEKATKNKKQKKQKNKKQKTKKTPLL